VIFNESTDAIFLVGPPPSTLILDCNQRAVEMFEQTNKTELIGTLGTSLQKYPLNPEEINAVGAEMAEKGYWSREIEYVTRSGRSFWANLAAKTITVAGETMQLIRLTDISDRKQLEFALQESESKTKDILNSTIAGIARMRVFKDGNWLIDQVSAGTELLCGYSAEALSRDSHLWVSLIDQEDWEANVEQMFAHIFAGTTYTYEYRLKRKDGQLRWISQTNNSSWDEMQQCWTLTAISIDITDRKQAELALQQSEATLRKAQSVAHIGSWEFEVETQTTFWSEELYRIYQCDPQQTPPHLEALLARFIYPEDKAIFESFVDRLTQGQSAEQDFRISLGDGSTRYIAAKGEPIFDQAGKLVRLVGTVLDITDRRKAELALRQSERKFKGAFDTITTGMALVSLAGGFQEVNASLCQMLGYTAEELLALRLQDIVHPEDQQLSLTALEQMMAGEIPGYQIEKRFLRRDEQSVWGLLNIALMRDTDNHPLYLIAQIVDMSERHRLDVIKDEFISVVSHELRTPLTSIRGSLGILDTGILSDEPETAQQMLNLALRSTDRLVRLVNDILDLERLESGKVVLVKEVCEVNDLMEQAIDSVQVLADQAGVRLKFDPLAAQTEADPDAIVQTLINLLSNAIKFSPAGGTVYLKAEGLAGEQGIRRDGETPTHPLTYLLLSVTDQGRGIPPEKLESVFGRFQQVDSSDSRQKEGTGLGLAICRSIVHQHGGQIWAESEVGQGSTFYFTLPIALEQ
jgi:PAS domain S-box-containing protein